MSNLDKKAFDYPEKIENEGVVITSSSLVWLILSESEEDTIDIDKKNKVNSEGLEEYLLEAFTDKKACDSPEEDIVITSSSLVWLILKE